MSVKKNRQYIADTIATRLREAMWLPDVTKVPPLNQIDAETKISLIGFLEGQIMAASIIYNEIMLPIRRMALDARESVKAGIEGDEGEIDHPNFIVRKEKDVHGGEPILIIVPKEIQ